MKKFAFSMFLVGVCSFLFLVGCQTEPNQNSEVLSVPVISFGHQSDLSSEMENASQISIPELEPVEREESKKFKDFSIELEQDSYPVGTQTIYFLVKNNRSEDTSIGDHNIKLEVQIKGRWYNIPLALVRDNYAYFHAKQEISWHVSLERLDSSEAELFPHAYMYDYHPGHYRIVFESTSPEGWTSAEFDLVE